MRHAPDHHRRSATPRARRPLRTSRRAPQATVRWERRRAPAPRRARASPRRRGSPRDAQPRRQATVERLADQGDLASVLKPRHARPARLLDQPMSGEPQRQRGGDRLQAATRTKPLDVDIVASDSSTCSASQRLIAVNGSTSFAVISHVTYTNLAFSSSPCTAIQCRSGSRNQRQRALLDAAVHDRQSVRAAQHFDRGLLAERRSVLSAERGRHGQAGRA